MLYVNSKISIQRRVGPMLSKLRQQKGFTMIELLIVVAIIGILATLVITNFRGAQAKTRDSKRQQAINSIHQKLEEYGQENSSYPDTVDASVLAGTDEKVFEDPDGNLIAVTTATAATLPTDPYTTATKPSGAQYSYLPYECTTDTSVTPNVTSCQSYVLYAWNESGEAGTDTSFIQKSL